MIFLTFHENMNFLSASRYFSSTTLHCVIINVDPIPLLWGNVLTNTKYCSDTSAYE